MKVGSAISSSNTFDWDRVKAGAWDETPATPDYKIVEETIAIGDLAEPLGFDTLWTSEHFGSPYVMTPNVLQWLAFWAGRTERIDLGSNVVVVTMHHPVTTAHEIAMLDILLRGRRFKLGIGRGIAIYQYEALGIDQNEGRQRFHEAIDIIRLALSKSRFSYDGEIFKVPEISIRPAPRHSDIGDNILCAFNTPESRAMAAENGLGQFFIPAAPIEQMRANVVAYNQVRAERGMAPDQPTLLVWCYCTETDEGAIKAAEYFQRYQQECIDQYGFKDAEKFRNIKGYERYADFKSTFGSLGTDVADPLNEPFLRNQLFGSPERIIRTVERLQKATGLKELAVHFHFGGMPIEDAIASKKLFAEKVLPTLQKMETPLMDMNWKPEEAAPIEAAA